LSIALTAAALIWLSALVLAPVAARRGQAPFLCALVYRAASGVCHQRPDRSFHLQGQQLPVCARCTGLYASGAIAAIAAWLGAATVPRRARLALIVAAIPTAVTLALEWTGSVNASNLLRAAAALPLGTAAGWIFVRMLRSEDMRYHS
jgi:uncharacterized membrane protein